MMSVGQMGCFLWSVCDWNIYQKTIRILVCRGLINEFSHDMPQNTALVKKKKRKIIFYKFTHTLYRNVSEFKTKKSFLTLKKIQVLKFFRCMNMFDYRLYVFHTLFGTVLLSGPKNSLVTRGAARKYVICWRVKNIQREKICQHKGRLEKLSNFFYEEKPVRRLIFYYPFIHNM